jgi:homoserine dehydrogenase
MIRIGLLGYGTVGQAFVALVNTQTRIPAEIVVALVRDPSRQRSGPQLRLTTNPEDVVARPDLDVVVDVMGGFQPACEWVLSAIRHGKSVLSANKELMARQGSTLHEASLEQNVFLAFEAAVGGGIPMVEPLRIHFGGAPVSRVLGILNGTTNFILSHLDAGESFQRALSAAQQAGYAEPDPIHDLDGSDLVRKLALVVGMVFGVAHDFVGTMPYRGIDENIAAVVRRVRPWGWRVKVLALADNQGQAFIGPMLVPAHHRLASVNGVDNAIGLEMYGQWFWLQGPGAGGPVTAVSLFADLCRGYELGFKPSPLAWLPPRTFSPLPLPWVGFGLDPDRAIDSFSAPRGARVEQDHWLTMPMDEGDARKWLDDNPGLMAYPVLVDGGI